MVKKARRALKVLLGSVVFRGAWARLVPKAQLGSVDCRVPRRSWGAWTAGCER